MINLHRMRKDEIIYMATHRCEHRHTFLEHPQCYHREPERIGFFDIEASSLDAGFGIILSYCIKDGGKDKIYKNIISLDDIKKAKAGNEDARLVEECIADLSRFDKIVTHYGNDYRYDVPFVRTRAVSLGLDFPTYGAIKQEDTYTILKSKFKLPRNRLETACRILLGTTEKNHIDPALWRAGARGDKKALSYILDHNERDVRDLEKLYNKIISFTKGTPRSI